MTQASPGERAEQTRRSLLVRCAAAALLLVSIVAVGSLPSDSAATGAVAVVRMDEPNFNPDRFERVTSTLLRQANVYGDVRAVPVRRTRLIELQVSATDAELAIERVNLARNELIDELNLTGLGSFAAVGEPVVRPASAASPVLAATMALVSFGALAIGLGGIALAWSAQDPANTSARR